MLAQIAAPPTPQTEAPRSPSRDAKGDSGGFAAMLDQIQSSGVTRRDAAEPLDDGARTPNADPSQPVAVMFLQMPADEAVPKGATGEAIEAVVEAAASGDPEPKTADGQPENAPATGAAPAAEDAFRAAADSGADSEGADAEPRLDARLRATIEAGAKGSGEADIPGSATQTTDDPAETSRSAAQQPSHATETARPGPHGSDMQPLQFDLKPGAAAAASAAQPHQPHTAPVPLDGVAVHIAKAAVDGIDRFRIELHPASLGGVDISIEISRDGRVDAVVRADRPETLDLLQRDARQLARALQDAGLQADSGSFAFERRDESSRQAREATADGAGPRGRGSEEQGLAADTIYRTVRPSGVDLRV